MRYGFYSVYYTDIHGRWSFLKKTDSVFEAGAYRKGGYLVKVNRDAYKNFLEAE